MGMTKLIQTVLYICIFSPHSRDPICGHRLGAPHVLIVQNPLPDHRSVHIATLDPRSTDLGIPSCIRTVPAATDQT